MVELKNSDFEAFKDEAKKWLDRFGLKDWNVYFRFEELDGCWAQCSANQPGRVATLALNRWPTEQPSEADVRRSAFHEVCELLLSSMECVALDEDLPLSERRYQTECARHAVIRRLENSVWSLE